MKSRLPISSYLIVSLGMSLLPWVKPDAHAGDVPGDISILPATVLRSDDVAESDYDFSGENWFALVCRASACERRLIDVTPEVQRDQNPQRKDPIQSLKLVRGEFVVVLFSGLPDTLHGTVPTWFTTRTSRSPADEITGSLGVRISTGKDSSYNLMPRWDPQVKQLTFYLESKDQRQPVGAVDINSINAGIRTTDILEWVGDIDGDAKIDLITGLSVDGGAGGIHLWLSSRAASGQMISEVASSYYRTSESDEE